MTEFSEAPAGAAVDDEQTDSRRIAIFGVAGVVVLALLAWLLLGQGSDPAEEAFTPSTNRVVKGAAATGTKAKPVATLPPHSNATLGRDPFKALVTPPLAGAVAGPGTGGVTPGVTPVGGAGSPTSGPTGPGTPTAQPTATKPPQSTTYSLRLTRIDGTGTALTARFLLGKSTVQYARVGSRFGRTAEIKLLSLQSDGNGQGTAVIQVGESPFDVSTGDPAIFVQ